MTDLITMLLFQDGVNFAVANPLVLKAANDNAIYSLIVVDHVLKLAKVFRFLGNRITLALPCNFYKKPGV